MPDASEAVGTSLLSWIYAVLGPVYVVLLLLAGLLSFVLALVVMMRGRGGMSATALLFIVPIPFLVGVFAALQGAIYAFFAVATSGSTPAASDLAYGISTALIAPLTGMLLMVPSYAVAVVGSFLRSFPAVSDRTPGK